MDRDQKGHLGMRGKSGVVAVPRYTWRRHHTTSDLVFLLPCLSWQLVMAVPGHSQLPHDTHRKHQIFLDDPLSGLAARPMGPPLPEEVPRKAFQGGSFCIDVRRPLMGRSWPYPPENQLEHATHSQDNVFSAKSGN